MKTFRVIYIITATTVSCKVITQRFAGNMKIAEKIADEIARQYHPAYVHIRKASSNERLWIDPEDVEG